MQSENKWQKKMMVWEKISTKGDLKINSFYYLFFF